MTRYESLVGFLLEPVQSSTGSPKAVLIIFRKHPALTVKSGHHL